MKKSISFLISVILIIAAVTIGSVTFISVSLTSHQLKNVVLATEESSKESNDIEVLIETLSSVHLSIVSLIGQKDIDQLETQVDIFNKQREKIKKDIASCSKCDKVWQESFTTYNQNLEKVLNELILVGKKSQATDFFIATLTPEFEELSKKLNDKQKTAQERILSTVSHSKQEQERLSSVLLILSSFLIIFFLTAGWWLSKKIKKYLLTTISSINLAGQTLEKSSNSLGNSSNELSNSAISSASSLEETVASLEEVSSIVDRNSQGAAECAKIADESLSLVNSGKKSIDDLKQSISSMSESSKRIEEIVGMIEDISFQTNLLALNAAVEAARAGEQGKGFAVVADAVRSLAQRASGSAKEISTLIQVASKTSQVSSVQVNQSHELFSKILESIAKLNYITKEISEGSREQSMGLKQISEELNHLDTISQNNSKEALETANTAQELAVQTKVLSSSIVELSKLAG